MATVLITGTSSGIGEACVARLASADWTVFAGVRRAEDGDRIKARHSGDVRPVLVDVTNRDHVQRAVAEITAECGTRGLDGLVNNAGVGTGGPIEYLDEDDWRSVFEVNFFSVVALTQATLPLLRTAQGRIVHIGSIGGRLSTPGLAPYSASKHALEALAEAQRHEYARSGSGVHVSLVEPGEVKTAIWDKGDATVDEIERRLDDDGRQRYGWLLDQSRGFLDEGRHRGVAAERVARAVEQALTATRPKARYLIGPDAKAYGHVLTRLPDRARDTLVALGSRRWERRGRKVRRVST
ncbi:MAG: SDR family oxidoreductase [Actinobacteria bacterium]|nr:SDR family oxidoreductase [Actinomycetota bacterium]